MSLYNDIETAETVTMSGPAFRAMMAVMREAAGDMLHRHVMVVQSAIDTARAGEPQLDAVRKNAARQMDALLAQKHPMMDDTAYEKYAGAVKLNMEDDANKPIDLVQAG
tara:strand:- start:30 stop:356 length:327 start_codon:yes stop_codon:yes gene_type:complete